jgi:hypothetical protein
VVTGAAALVVVAVAAGLTDVAAAPPEQVPKDALQFVQ